MSTNTAQNTAQTNPQSLRQNLNTLNRISEKMLKELSAKNEILESGLNESAKYNLTKK